MNRNTKKVPSRPAPSIENVDSNKNPHRGLFFQPVKKKPPPRPPPPNFSKMKSKSAWNLNNQVGSSLSSLIDLSPETPKWKNILNSGSYSGGSVCSSFSSSTSSLASSKKSFESDSSNFEHWALSNPTNNTSSGLSSKCSELYFSGHSYQISVENAPTIIRTNAVRKKQIPKSKTKEIILRESSPPMPKVPAPSPPKSEYQEVTVPYAIALYDYEGAHEDDLKFKADEIIFLLRRINTEWLYGKVEDREGLCPNNYISVQVPLPEDDKLVFALYEFIPQAPNDLSLKPGQSVVVTGRVSKDWLIGESNGRYGQFPANFVDRIPSSI